MDFDSGVVPVNDKQESHSGTKLKRRPGLQKGRQRPVSLRSKAELVQSLPSDDNEHPLGNSDDEPSQGQRPSEHRII